MQTPAYVDLFATKGIEYLLVIGFLLALAFFWRFLNKGTRPTAGMHGARRLSDVSGWFRLAPDRYYHPGHAWALPDDAGVITVGIDDFAQKLIGRPSAIELPDVGTHVEQGTPGVGLQVDSESFYVLSPIDGEVVASNAAIRRAPDLVNSDPYGDGWLVKVKPTRLKANLTGLLRGRLATAWMATTEDALRRRMSPDLGLVLQDGGVPVNGIARSLSNDAWGDIARNFLLTE